VCLSMCASTCVDNTAESTETRRHELELSVVKLQQQLDSVSERAADTEHQLKLALERVKLAHDSDVDRLNADKVRAVQYLAASNDSNNNKSSK